MKCPRYSIRSIFILVAICGVIFGGIEFFIQRSRGQREAMHELHQSATLAVSRLGGNECFPRYSFASGGPKFLEDLIGPTYFCKVTEVFFERCDDQQLKEALPHLKRFSNLNRIRLATAVGADTVTEARTALPTVSITDSVGIELP
jgi:hypothetical protein